MKRYGGYLSLVNPAKKSAQAQIKTWLKNKGFEARMLRRTVTPATILAVLTLILNNTANALLTNSVFSV